MESLSVRPLTVANDARPEEGLLAGESPRRGDPDPDARSAGIHPVEGIRPPEGVIPIRMPGVPEFSMVSHNDDTVVKELHWTGYSGWERTSLQIWSALAARASG